MVSSSETISGYRSLEHVRHRPMLGRASTFDRGMAFGTSSSTGTSLERSSFEGSFERGASFEGASLPPPSVHLSSQMQASSRRCPRASFVAATKGVPIGSTYHPLIHHGQHLSDAVRTAQLITQYGVRRRVRPPSLAEREWMMGSSLPSRYESYAGHSSHGSPRSGTPRQAYDPVTGESISVHFDTTRPEFRKSSSQPTRAVSPALSLHSPTQPGHRPPSSGHHIPYSVTDRDLGRRVPGEYYFESESVMKKRVLPQVPPDSSPVTTGRHHRYSSEYLQSHHRPPSSESRYPSDLYSSGHGTDHDVYPYQGLSREGSREEYQRQYSGSHYPTRPEFRKSSSQPARVVSPAFGIQSPTHRPLSGQAHPYSMTEAELGRRTPGQYYFESESVIKKRVLPQVLSASSPVIGRHHRYSSEYLQSHHQPPSSESRYQRDEQQRLLDIQRSGHGTDHEVYPYQRLSREESGEEQLQYQRQYSGSRPSSAAGGARRASPAGHGMSDSEVAGHLTTGHVASRRPSYVEAGAATASRRESLTRRDSLTRRGSQDLAAPRISRRYSRQVDESEPYTDTYKPQYRRDTSRDRESSAELMARLKDEGNIHEYGHEERRHEDRQRTSGHEGDDYIRDHPLKDPELTSRVVRRRGAFGTLEGAAEGVEPGAGVEHERRSLSGSRQTLTDAGHQSRSMARRIDHKHGPGSGSESGHRPGLASSQRSLDKGLDEELQSEAEGSGRGAETPGDRTESGMGSATGMRKKHGPDGGMSKAHSTSTQHLSGAAKKRLGFRKKNAATFFVHRSEEVAPDEVRHMVKQASSTSDGEGSISGESASTWVPAMRLQAEGEVSNFVEGLGPGQLVGRQALAAVNYGDIQLSICERRGNVEVEVIRARNLMTKPGARMLPATYVKVYMMKQRKCVAKARTVLARRTLDPLYQQQLVFNHDYHQTILQITVWGDYGRLDKKVFMGMAQICLDDLDLSNIVIGWYKLLPPTSATITNMAPSAALQEAREAKLAAMAGNMKFFAE